MEESVLIDRIQELTDLELALLLSLIAGEHCMIQTDEETPDAIGEEIQLIASNVFGLSHAIVHCTSSTTLDEFSNGVLADRDFYHGPDATREDEANQTSSLNLNTTSSRAYTAAPSIKSVGRHDDRPIASIVILKNLNLADEQIQIQALELLRTKRIFTRTALHSAPKSFLIVVLRSNSERPLVNHLNDHLFISHYHGPDEGFANLEEGCGWIEDDQASLTSVVHRSVAQGSAQSPVFSYEDIRTLAALRDKVTVTAELTSYLHNIVTFLRVHRAVGGGITPRATRHFNLLVKCLAPLHRIDFVTPSLVSMAARKIYLHRIEITAPENERSMQYGSDLAAVTALLQDVTAEQIIEEVLVEVEAPL
ncbi:hypothetical protein MMC07_002122 [Pseudocyphellaria aurata]|nr:hypothetical protein [Pseudocyphellaria aurata]